tara:strand:+ start:1148 stop:1612 length:465 start_codon:yes stop_codon:yes gene_type:complete
MIAKILTKKNATYAAYAVGGLFVAKKIFDYFKSTSKQTLKDVETEVVRLEKAGMQPSRSLGQWKLVADSIYNSMKFSYVSDNKSNIEEQLKMVKNDLDLALLVKAYGLRQHYTFAIPDGNRTTLIGQIATGELSNSRLKSINDNYSQKGITYRF